MNENHGIQVDLDELIRLRSLAKGLELGTQQRALSTQAGGYLSVFHGRGLEFDEVREYQPGDDARNIDWRVTARRGGRPHTKLFCEERERPVYVLADFHSGMYFGTQLQFKSALVARAAALIAWTAALSGDRIGGIISSQTSVIVPAKARRSGVLRWLKALQENQPKKPGEVRAGFLDHSLARMVRLSGHGSLIFLLSDFRELSKEGAKHLAALSRHNDVILGYVYDPLEMEPPTQGRFKLGTPAHQISVDSASQHVSEQWKESFKAHHEHLHAIARKFSLPLLDLCTDVEALTSLRRGLALHRKSR